MLWVFYFFPFFFPPPLVVVVVLFCSVLLSFVLLYCWTPRYFAERFSYCEPCFKTRVIVAPCRDVAQPGTHPESSNRIQNSSPGHRPAPRTAHTFFFLWDHFYFILFWKKSLASHISILWKGNPNQIWFFYRKSFQPTLYLWLCIPVLWLPISLSGEYSRESLFGLYNTHPHKQNNNNSLKGWIQWPVLPLPFPSFVPPLFLHINFLFFSHGGDWD